MKIAIGLGASLGPRRDTLERTVQQLHAHADCTIVRVSRWYRSAPMRGGTASGLFLNGVAVVDTTLRPRALLAVCQDLEEDAGRRRARYWGDRTLDLDLLYAEGAEDDATDLTLPHPGLWSRPFVYWPLWEAWPDLRPLLRQRPAPPRHGIVAVGAFARAALTPYAPSPLPEHPR